MSEPSVEVIPAGVTPLYVELGTNPDGNDVHVDISTVEGSPVHVDLGSNPDEPSMVLVDIGVNPDGPLPIAVDLGIMPGPPGPRGEPGPPGTSFDEDALFALVASFIRAGENVTIDIDETARTITVNSTGVSEPTTFGFGDGPFGETLFGGSA